MRAESRTERILKAALEELEGKYEIEILNVDELGFQPLSRDIFNKRCSEEVDEKAIVTAMKVAAADRIVVAVLGYELPCCSQGLFREPFPLQHHFRR